MKLRNYSMGDVVYAKVRWNALNPPNKLRHLIKRPNDGIERNEGLGKVTAKVRQWDTWYLVEFFENAQAVPFSRDELKLVCRGKKSFEEKCKICEYRFKCWTV